MDEKQLVVSISEMDAQRLKEILEEMHMIANPGEYGLGSEPKSIPDNDKAAWERMGELIEEAQQLTEE